MSTAAKRRLNDVLFGQTRGRILALLYGTPDQPYWMRQIARHVGTSAGNVQRELETLTAIGLIERSTVGNVTLFQANSNHPVFREIRALITKTAGSFHALRIALEPLAPRISFALVYGSVARGEEDASSDIDLMVVGRVTFDQLLTQLKPVEEILGRSINPTVYSLREFKLKLRAGNHFLRSIIHGKNVFLIGDEDEFRKNGLSTAGSGQNRPALMRFAAWSAS
jgi:predicted nucleotidyltransferase